jgi:hypothetical protein
MTAVSPDRRRHHILISPEKITIRHRIPTARRQRRGRPPATPSLTRKEGETIALASWPRHRRQATTRLLDGKVVADPSNPIGFTADGKSFRTCPKASPRLAGGDGPATLRARGHGHAVPRRSAHSVPRRQPPPQKHKPRGIKRSDFPTRKTGNASRRTPARREIVSEYSNAWIDMRHDNAAG